LLDIAYRRLAEMAFILTAEMRLVIVSDAISSFTGVEVLRTRPVRNAAP
jgi:hypothetical protein